MKTRQGSTAWMLTAVAMVVAAAVGGCHPRGPIVPPGTMPPPVADPGASLTYNQLVQRYNATVAPLDQVWAATDVAIRWRDDEGDAHFEQGDGKFLFVRPGRVALTVEKLGKTYLWAGSDAERFWMFDNQAHVAYVGRHDAIGRPCAEPLPLPVHPSAVPYLLGLMPLEPVPADGQPMVMRVRGYHLVEPPGMNLALWLDPHTFRPVRVDLTDALGRSVVRAMLSDEKPVDVRGDAAQPPTMPGQAELFVHGREARMTLKLSRLSDGRSRHRIRDAAFDFERLLRAHEPETVVELDGDCR